MNYSELLEDDRWLDKRDEILERDNHTCQECGESDCELHVHHKWYKYGIEPWGYPNSCYVTLCADCHAAKH